MKHERKGTWRDEYIQGYRDQTQEIVRNLHARIAELEREVEVLNKQSNGWQIQASQLEANCEAREARQGGKQ